MTNRIVEEEDYTQPPLPHIITSRWYEAIFDDCEVRDANKVKLGEHFLALYSGQAVLYKSYDVDNYGSFSHITTRMEMKEAKPLKVTVDSFAIYVVINMPRLVKCTWGYRSECFKPQVKDGDKWREASDAECAHWSEFSESKRRIIYCVGVLSDDENTS